jgi:DNA mismatch repair protein MutL
MSPNNINILSTLLSNMIAAGEVIERPSSVIKELIENSLDANSQRIEIHLRNAGRTRIEVLDDGDGMNKDNLLLSIMRHATSKIEDEHDLFRIKTLGFRGEALPSIASVSHLTITSSQGDIGYTLQVEGSMQSIQPSPARKGTSIIVEDLFYNTPARLKYLKNDYIEASSCIDIVSKFALAYPKVSFHLTVDEKVTFTTDGKGEVLSVVQTIFGHDVASKMKKIEIEHPDFQLQGYLGLPEVSKSHRYQMYTFVNGRIVYMQKINQTIIEAFKPYLPPVRYPFVILSFTIDPSLLDVNVHPSKREIRFSKENLLKTVLFETISERLKSTNLSVLPQTYTPLPTLNAQGKLEESDPTYEQLNLEFDQIHPSLSLKVIGQLNALYIVCEDGMGGMYVLDQHAVDERINYEKNLKIVKQHRHQVEPLIPLIIQVNASTEKKISSKTLDQLDSVGVKLVKFGPTTYKVETLPLWVLEDVDPKFYVEQLLEQVLENVHLEEDALRLYAIASKSCKSSIKANQYVSMEGLQSVVDRLLGCDYPYSCPHGRPTMIHWSKFQLEKLFNRSGF